MIILCINERKPVLHTLKLLKNVSGTACIGSILCTGGPDVIRKEAWSFYRTISGVRLCWELEEPQGPKTPAPKRLSTSIGDPRKNEAMARPEESGEHRRHAFLTHNFNGDSSLFWNLVPWLCGGYSRHVGGDVAPYLEAEAGPPGTRMTSRRQRESFIDNLLVRIHFTIEVIWWTGLAP